MLATRQRVHLEGNLAQEKRQQEACLVMTLSQMHRIDEKEGTR
jgi:hypothetical protein